MIAAFDARFPLTQSLYNWSQDLEMELGNAGHDDPAKFYVHHGFIPAPGHPLRLYRRMKDIRASLR